jgi:hypothetical protein
MPLPRRPSDRHRDVRTWTRSARLFAVRVGQIIMAIERMGFQVVKARRLEDAEIAVQTALSRC